MSSERRAVVRARSTRSLTGTQTVLGSRRTWGLGALAILLLLGLAFWVNRTVERSIAAQLRENLEAIRDSQVEAIRNWSASQLRVVEEVGTDADLLDEVRALSAVPHNDERRLGLLQSPHQSKIRRQLNLVIQGFGYVGFAVTDPSGTILCARLDRYVGQRVDLPALPKAKEPWLTLPTRLTIGGVQTPLMMAASTPLVDHGKRLGALHLMLDPTRSFSDIVRVARAGRTGETYVFGRDGRLLSDSRFLDDLRKAGLVGPKAETAIWEVDIRDPGGNLLEGYRSPQARSQQPLTLMAREAIEHGSGSNVRGYADYRGVPVVGAWTWIDDLDLGLATEMDLAEAFELRDKLQWAFLALLGVLALTLAGVVVSAHIVTRLNHKTLAAERRAMKLGQYTLDRKLGEGGMGAVYEGHHGMLRRRTAIKLLKASNEGPDQTRRDIARFEREVQATSLLTHPNTIAVYDYGKTPDGTFYYAMEYLDGVNLDDLVMRSGPLPPGRIIHLMLQACGSLAEAHAAKMVHRDIKPANMMVCERGGVQDTLKVLDFGLVSSGLDQNEQSKLTAVGVLMGTPHYLAPEVVKDAEAASPLSDIYAMGGTMYFLATAHDVFEKSTITAICMAHMVEQPDPPSVHIPLPDDFQALILRCLAKNPKERPRSMRELADALRACEEAGTWTSDDAEAWWARNGTEVKAGVRERTSVVSTSSATVEIDVQGRLSG